jgi:hypothetical protein
MRHSNIWWVFAVVMVVLDFYVFQAVKTVSINTSERTKNIIFYSYWSVSAATLLCFILFPQVQAFQTSKFFLLTLSTSSTILH